MLKHKQNFCLIFCCLLFLVTSVFSSKIIAQNSLEYGVKFGLNLSDLITDESRISPRPTFSFGVESAFRLTESWQLQTELLYSRQGNVRRGRTSEGVRFDNTLILDYINIPLMANYFVAEGFYVGAGPQVGILVRALQDDTTGFMSSQQSVNSRYKALDFSGVFNVGYLTEWGFSVGLRYQLGLIDILQENLEYTASQRHSVLQMYMGVRF
jgi:hypothetical protein